MYTTLLCIIIFEQKKKVYSFHSLRLSACVDDTFIILDWVFYRLSQISVLMIWETSGCKMQNQQDKFVECISPTKGYFKERCKSQNINPIYLGPKSTLDIIQIITKPVKYVSILCFMKIYLSAQFQYMTIQLNPRVKVLVCMLVYTSFILI